MNTPEKQSDDMNVRCIVECPRVINLFRRQQELLLEIEDLSEFKSNPKSQLDYVAGQLQQVRESALLQDMIRGGGVDIPAFEAALVDKFHGQYKVESDMVEPKISLLRTEIEEIIAEKVRLIPGCLGPVEYGGPSQSTDRTFRIIACDSPLAPNMSLTEPVHIIREA